MTIKALCLDLGAETTLDRDSSGPQFYLNADERETTVNGKPSLTIEQAGFKLIGGEPGWSGALGVGFTVTYAFRATAPNRMPEDTGGFSRFSALQIAQAELALTGWSDVANIVFVRIGAGNSGEEAYSNAAAMLFSNYSTGQDNAAAFAMYPGNTNPSSTSGDIWINSTLAYNKTPVTGGYGGMVLVHEIGHAIGLAHPADYNSSDDVSITYAADAEYYEDSRQYTVMSYFSETNTGANYFGAYSAAPLLDDISAAQQEYGANLTTRVGDTVYGFNSTAERPWYLASSTSSRLIFAIWDAGGVDTLDFSGFRQAQKIELREGFFSDVGGLVGNIAIAAGAKIENAKGGSGADLITGNALANSVFGGAGGDTLHGGDGNDQLSGDAGHDILDGGAGVDTAFFSGLKANYSWVLATGGGAGWMVTDLRGGSPDGVDQIVNVEYLKFSDATVRLVSGAQVLDATTSQAIVNLLRMPATDALVGDLTESLAQRMEEGSLSNAQAIELVVKAADATTSVATLNYQFFTGKTPTQTGVDYLVSPSGGNANNINSAYYQSFSLENRYINFAVNLGKAGEGQANFALNYGSLSLFDATKLAYSKIFGGTASDAKIHAILDTTLVLGGVAMSRGDYFAYYGQDGLTGIGAKAAMVGWLLAEGEKADLGLYARANAAFLTDLADGATYSIDLIGVYGKADYVFNG